VNNQEKERGRRNWKAGKSRKAGKYGKPVRYEKNREMVKSGKSGGGGGTVWIKVRSLADTTMPLPVRPQKFIIELGRRDMGQRGRGKRRKKQVPVIWALPPVIFERDLAHYTRRVDQLIAEGYREFQLGHIGQRAMFLSSSGKLRQEVILYGDYTLNLLNSLSLREVKSLGLARGQFSLETDRENMQAALAANRGAGKRQGLLKTGIMTYGRPPLFTARLTGEHLQTGTSFKSPKGERFVLDVHNDLTRVRAENPFSLLAYQSELRDCGSDYFVIDISGGHPKKESSLVAELVKNRAGKRHVLTGNFHGKLL